MTPPNDPFDFSDYSSSAPPQGSSGGGVGPGPVPWGDPGRANPNPFGTPDTAGAPITGGPSPWNSTPTPGAESGFGATQAAQPEIVVAKPPAVWLGLAAAAALAGVLAALIGWGSSGLAILGWALSGPIAIGLLAVFTLLDTSRRAAAVYAAPGWAKPMYWGVLVVAGVGILLNAWLIADWIGRL